MSRQNIVWKMPTVTVDGLKNFACAMMLFQTIGITVIQNGIIHLEQYTKESLAAAMETDSHLVMLAGISSVLQLLGGLVLPIAAFLLVEGFRNTLNYKKCLLIMIGFAVISEIPYDLAMSLKVWDLSSQNMLFSMAICLLMLYFLDRVKEKKGMIISILRVWIVICAVIWVTLIRAQYGFCIVLLTAVFYLFYKNYVLKTILGIIVSLLYVTGPLAFYGIWCYNEQYKDNRLKYVYYVFYPLHFLILGGIVRGFMM